MLGDRALTAPERSRLPVIPAHTVAKCKTTGSATIPMHPAQALIALWAWERDSGVTRRLVPLSPLVLRLAGGHLATGSGLPISLQSNLALRTILDSQATRRSNVRRTPGKLNSVTTVLWVNGADGETGRHGDGEH
jgi:hypothetical protein